MSPHVAKLGFVLMVLGPQKADQRDKPQGTSDYETTICLTPAKKDISKGDKHRVNVEGDYIGH